MKKISETIVFFGSGPVAAASLEKLVNSFSIEAVITKPQPPNHKYEFPVLNTANKHSLRILTVSTKSDLEKLFNEQFFKSKIGLVIDYGIIISQPVIDYFPLGIVNSHFSLLPKLRGADPISFAILSGRPKTGVSLMLISQGLDEGPILSQSTIEIDSSMTNPRLTKDLINLSQSLLEKTLPEYVKGKINPKPQLGQPSYSRKLSKQDSYLDWSKPAALLEREVRAYYEWPRSKAKLGEHRVIVTKAHTIPGVGKPGSIVARDKQLGVQTADEILIIDKLIPQGKKEMPASAFLAGYSIKSV
jgi:methionyl-tRNA formyltransferase